MVLRHTWDTFPLPHYLLQNESEYIQTWVFYFVSKACKRHFTLLKPWSPDTETGKVQVICENVTKALNKSHPIPFVVFLKKNLNGAASAGFLQLFQQFQQNRFSLHTSLKVFFSSNVFYASVIWQNTLFKRAWTTLRIFTQPTHQTFVTTAPIVVFTIISHHHCHLGIYHSTIIKPSMWNLPHVLPLPLLRFRDSASENR